MNKDPLSIKERFGCAGGGFASYLYFGIFWQKIGWSIGPALSIALPGCFGFVANQNQASETIHGLRMIMSWIPAVFAGLVVFFCKIDAKTKKELEEAMLQQEQADA